MCKLLRSLFGVQLMRILSPCHDHKNLAGTARSAMNSVDSPRTGAAAAPVVNLVPGSSSLSPRSSRNSSILLGQLSSSSLNNSVSAGHALSHLTPSSPHGPSVARRRRSHSGENMSSPNSAAAAGRHGRKSLNDASTAAAKAQSRSAQKTNDSMVYLEGPQIYTCAQCRTHLTSHDEIISKSFHGRHGKVFLRRKC